MNRTRIDLDVYGRRMRALREGERWRLFDLGNDGTHRPARDVTLPASLQPGEIAGWLGDLLHEAATPRHPDVRVLRRED